MRKSVSFLLLSVMLLTAVLSACDAGGGDFKVGLVTDVGRINDRSFNQSAWEGVLAAAEDLGLEEGEDIKYIETKDSKDYQDNMRQFADEGFDVIVTVGFALGSATVEMAAEYPDINFIGVDQFQGEAVDNVAGLIFREDHSGYLAGALAAYMSTYGIIGGVYGTDQVPPVVAFKEGYDAGAKSVNPDITIISAYHPGAIDQAFTDPEWGGATAAQAIDQGADVIFGAGGMTGNGALEEVATHEGLYCIGVDSDQWETVPAAHGCLISSAMKLITPGVQELINLAKEDNFPAGNYYGGAGLASFHDFEDVIPPDVKKALIDIDTGLKDGSISTGYGG
jgi:basic membrane protein A